MPAEMIAMLDGLGSYGQNPIGDVDRRLLPAMQTTPPQRTWGTVAPTYPPQPYTLGQTDAASSEDDLGRNEGITLPKVLMGAGGLLLAVWGIQKYRSRSNGGPVAGYPEPEMIEIPAPKRRRRRKARKEK